jgi:hypothetical protein
MDINNINKFFQRTITNFELEIYNRDQIDYLYFDEEAKKYYAIVFFELQKVIDEKFIKSKSTGLRKFHNQYPNTEFFLFVKYPDKLNNAAWNYTQSKMCILDYVTLDKENKRKNKKPIFSEKSKDELLKEKGNNYEIFCGQIIESQGFIIKYNGLENGVNDNSIDLIAIKKDLILLIQCKDWHESYCKKNGYLSEKNFKSFVGQCDDFVANNPVYQDFKIQKYWFVSDIKTVDEQGLEYLKLVKNNSNFYLQELKNPNTKEIKFMKKIDAIKKMLNNTTIESIEIEETTIFFWGLDIDLKDYSDNEIINLYEKEL